MGEDYKVEIIAGIPEERVSLYRQGEFVDLCRGPHVPSTGRIKAFKLTSVAGAYWRGDERNEMLQRIYGTAWANAKDLEAYLERIEEAKQRDHRRLGQQLDLFSLHPIAPGSPFFHPKGAIVYNTLIAVHPQPLRPLRLQRGHHAADLQDRAVEDARGTTTTTARTCSSWPSTRTSTASSR